MPSPCRALGTSCELGTAGTADQGAWDGNLEEPWGPEQPHACLPGAACPYPSAEACADPRAELQTAAPGR